VAYTKPTSYPPTDLPPAPIPTDVSPGASQAADQPPALTAGEAAAAEQTEAPPIDTDRLPPTPMEE